MCILFYFRRALLGKYKLEIINYDIRYLIQFLKSSLGKKKRKDGENEKERE